MAWVGTYDTGRPEQVRVEAAAWQGWPVYFDISGEWRKAGESADYTPASTVAVTFACLFVFLFAGAVLVARHNLRVGRGDKKGAGKNCRSLFPVRVRGVFCS